MSQSLLSSPQKLEQRRAADQQLLDDYVLARHGKHAPHDCWGRLWKSLFPRLCVQAAFELRQNTSGHTGQLLGREAEDVAAETVTTLHLYLMLPSCGTIETLWGLACAMLMRRLNNLRRLKPFQQEQLSPLQKDEPEQERIPDTGWGELELGIEHDRTDATTNCLEKLPPDERFLLLERHGDERPTWEGLAELLRLTPDRVRSRYKKARERVKWCLSNTAAELFPELRQKEQHL